MAYTAIDNSADYFEVIKYAGDGNTTQAITANFQVDLSWIKHLGTTAAHTIQDSTRGWNAANKLSSNETDEENDTSGATWENYGHVSAVSSSNFTVTRGSNTPYQTNASSSDYIAWHWKESATAGFDIVGYTGNGSNRTISHSLSAVPHVYIVKSRTGNFGWQIYHHKNTSAPETDYLSWNNSDATVDEATSWNDTAPTSSVFSLGTTDATNKNTVTHIAYLFAPKQGYSKFGAYTGGTDPFVYLGFRPAFILFKNASAAENYRIIDNKRDTYNPAVAHLYPNLNNAQGSGASYSDYCDFLSNGFKIRSGSGEVDGSGNTITYMAFAEAPFVNSKGVPCNAR